MSARGCVAHLVEGSAFFGLFDGRVPIVTPMEAGANLEYGADDVRPESVYFVDVHALSVEQLDGVVMALAVQSGMSAMVIRTEILERGLPLRCSQVKSVEFDARRIL